MGRTVHLSRSGPPGGRPLLFVKALHEVSTLSGTEAIHRMYDLYFARRELPGPVVVALKDGIDTSAFERLCEEYGISARIEEA